MVGLEFHDFSQTLPMVLRPMVAVLDDKLKGSLSGFVGALLLRDYDVLVAFTEYNRNVIRLEPPLICGASMSTRFVDALDSPAVARHRRDREGFREEPARLTGGCRPPIRRGRPRAARRPPTRSARRAASCASAMPSMVKKLSGKRWWCGATSLSARGASMKHSSSNQAQSSAQFQQRCFL